MIHPIMRWINFPLRTTGFIFYFIILTLPLAANSNHPDKDAAGFNRLKSISPKAQQVKVGFYVENVYELNQTSNTYYIDFYVWFRWKGNINPIDKMEFMNGVEDWGMTKVNAYDEPKLLSDGSYYQSIRVEGRFRGDFEFARYPLDQQNLTVIIENSVYSSDELVYLADTSESGYTEDLSIPGWQFNQFNMENLIHKYNSNFGDPETKEKISNYSALRFELVVSRPVNYFIWKLLLPLIIVLLSSWGALLLDPVRVDSRILMPITALLTTVFLQQAYSDALPAVSHLVLIDKIYVLAYILIIAAIMETIYTAGIVHKDKPEANKKVRKIDRVFLLCNGLFLSFGVVLLLVL